ncbi:hypothetical protein CO57_p00410 (plasmid) [Escherichia coli]|nr:hypothetical protein CO57_p00410 [Escherichia coli]
MKLLNNTESQSCSGVYLVFIFVLPVESHMIYFLNTDTNVIIIRILIQHQDAVSHLNWQ